MKGEFEEKSYLQQVVGLVQCRKKFLLNLQAFLQDKFAV
jgi:hypothetical protein